MKKVKFCHLLSSYTFVFYCLDTPGLFFARVGGVGGSYPPQCEDILILVKLCPVFL